MKLKAFRAKINPLNSLSLFRYLNDEGIFLNVSLGIGSKCVKIICITEDGVSRRRSALKYTLGAGEKDEASGRKANPRDKEQDGISQTHKGPGRTVCSRNLFITKNATLGRKIFGPDRIAWPLLSLDRKIRNRSGFHDERLGRSSRGSDDRDQSELLRIRGCPGMPNCGKISGLPIRWR